MEKRYEGPDRRQEGLELERRLTRLETTMDHTGKGVEALREEVATFKSELFSILNPMRGKIERHDTDLAWLRSMTWKILAGASAIGGLAGMAMKLL